MLKQSVLRIWLPSFYQVIAVACLALTIQACASAQAVSWNQLASQSATDLRVVGPGKDRNCRADQLSLSALLGRLLNPKPGVSFDPVYTGEVLSNTRGGISASNATQYEALLNLPMTLDFEKLHVPLPGRFFLLAQNTHGRGLTEDFVGDTQVISNIDSFNNIMQVSEYWWELGLLDDKLIVRLGKQDLNTEFLVMDLAGDFLNASFGISPSSGFSSYPNPSMAAVALAQLAPSLKLKAGIWDALSDGGNWGISGNEVTFSFVELEYKFELCDGRLPGSVDVGFLYISGGDVFEVTAPSASGYYIQFEQLLFRENPDDDDDQQGFGVFASYFPRFANGPVPFPVILEDVVLGIVYKGPLPCRDEDAIGLGVAWARFNSGGTNQETAVEFFYKAQITPRLSLQPDLQFIATPSGIYRDALVAGLRFQVTF